MQREDKLLEKKEITEGSQMFLNVYHLSKLNPYLFAFGIGLYTSAIQINETEYNYSFRKGKSGISILPFGSHNLRFKERVFLGNTLFKTEEINKLLCVVSYSWTGDTYDFFEKNSNHFSIFLCEKILQDKFIFPDYLNRIIDLSVYFDFFLHPLKDYLKNLSNMSEEFALNIEEDFRNLIIRKNPQHVDDYKHKALEVELCKANYLPEVPFRTYQKVEPIENEQIMLDIDSQDFRLCRNTEEIFKIIEELDKHNIFLCNSNDNEDQFDGFEQEEESKFGKKRMINQNIFKYLKLADKLAFQEKNFEKALMTYKYSLDLVEEVEVVGKKGELKEIKNLLSSSDSKCKQFRSESEESISLDMIHTIIELEDYLVNLKVKIYHSTVYCQQKLGNQELCYAYCEKILLLSENEIFALAKKGIYLHLIGKDTDAECDIQTAYSLCRDENIQTIIKEIEKVITRI